MPALREISWLFANSTEVARCPGPTVAHLLLARARLRSSSALALLSIARLTEWRDRALAGAATALKERERDDRDDEIARLKSKVGEITMDNELLNAKIAALEGKRPLAHRRSRR